MPQSSSPLYKALLRYKFNLDRRPALLSVLRTLLVTYSALMGSLLVPPPLSPETPPEWDRHISWITVLSQNLMAAANDLRPVQVRALFLR